MPNPKISYQIDAEATGAAEVAKLTGELDKLGQSVDPAVAGRAQALAGALRDLSAKQEAVDTFARLRRELDESKTAMAQAQSAAQQLGRELAATANPTRQQAGQLEKLRDAVRQAKEQVQSNGVALDQARAKLTGYGISSGNVAQAQVALRRALADTTAEAKTLGQAYAGQAQAAQASAQAQVRSAEQVRAATVGIGTELAKLQRLAGVALGGTLVGSLASDLAGVADQYANLAARIKLVTGEGAAFDSAFQGVFEVATKTNSSLETTGTLFARIAQAGKQFGLQQSEALALTQAINQATQLSGSSAQASDAAITQLIQGLQSGVLRGEEFNSVMEQAPRLAQALADGLGVTTGELRKLAEAGTLTSATVIKALQGQAQVLASEFDKLPPTVGRALTNLSTQWTRYIGETDQAGGVSAKAAAAITALANNLNTVAELAYRVGQAWVAYKAIDIAGSLIAQVTASRAAAVATTAEAAATAGAAAATTAHTGALGANTAAKAANAAASRGLAAAATGEAAARTAATAAAGASLGVLARLAGAAGVILAVGGDLIVSTFKTAGTWIGEAAAKLAGYKDRSAEVAEQDKATAQAVAENARQQAALAQKAQLAQEAALGLGKRSKELVGEFDGLVLKGDSAAQALEKLGKSFDLGDISGIRDAITALDALEVKGKITAAQLRATLGDALKGQDLAKFKTEAIAAFDGSEQGVRRLNAALAALSDEALKRAGTSLQELQTGFSTAATSAINDFDALRQVIVDLGDKSPRAGQVLAEALDKALAAANTEKAVQAVIARLQEAKDQGLIFGDAFVAGMDKAKAKLDELKPGISSLGEALKTFGLKSKEELTNTATKLGEAYRRIANDTSVSVADKIKAFQQFAEAATAANGGVETSEVKLQRRILELQAAAKGLGDDLAKAGKQGAESFDRAADAAKKWKDFLEADPDRLVSGSGGIGFNAGGFGGSAASGGSGSSSGSGSGSSGSVLGAGGGAVSFSGGGQYTPPDDSGDWYFDTAAFQREGSPYMLNDAALRFWRLTPEAYARRTGQAPSSGGPSRPSLSLAQQVGELDAIRAANPSAGRVIQPGTGAEAGGTSIVVNLGGRSATVTADPSNAQALVRLLQEQARQAGGG